MVRLSDEVLSDFVKPLLREMFVPSDTHVHGSTKREIRSGFSAVIGYVPLCHSGVAEYLELRFPEAVVEGSPACQN